MDIAITHARVNRNERYMNAPDITLFVDRLPDGDAFRWEERDGMYRAQSGPWVVFYHYDGPGIGFGGARFDIKMQDGEWRELIGPWSSSDIYCNKIYPDRDPCVEVRLRPHGEALAYAGWAMTVEALAGIMKAYCPDWELARHDRIEGEPEWLLRLKGKPFKHEAHGLYR